MTGQVDIAFITPASATGLIKEGKILGLASGGPGRVAALPDMPTISEVMGWPDYSAHTWTMLIGPKGMPEDVTAPQRGDDQDSGGPRSPVPAGEAGAGRHGREPRGHGRLRPVGGEAVPGHRPPQRHQARRRRAARLPHRAGAPRILNSSQPAADDPLAGGACISAAVALRSIW